MVENFRLTRATENKSGFFTADVIIYQDDGEVGFEIRKEIPALGGKSNMTEAEDAESKTDTDDESNSSEYDQTVDKPTSANPQKDLAAASKAINAAMYDFEVSNDTTRDDILKMAKYAISEQNAVSVSLNSSDFTIIKASTTLNGTLSATVIYLWKNAGSPETKTTSLFTDVASSSEYAEAVAWAVKNNITSGTSDTTFSPDMTCTRGQIVTFLFRAIK